MALYPSVFKHPLFIDKRVGTTHKHFFCDKRDFWAFFVAVSALLLRRGLRLRSCGTVPLVCALLVALRACHLFLLPAAF